MTSEIHMTDPMCLIANVKGKLMANQEALGILSAIPQPVVVVAIAGLYRTGKSYLMNRLARKKTGFPLGSTVQSHTKGIWMWCVPHPQKPDHTLVLLDTEGLGDVEKGDSQNDCWIFALAVLLSSTFVYNSMGTINQQAMDQLHYVTELTDRIRVRSSPDTDRMENSADFVSFFPDFAWTLRDMTLLLEADGRPLTADEYLEKSLKLKQGTSEDDKKYNLPRLCIRKFFPKKKCFIFYPPTEWKRLAELETLRDSELDPDFVQQVEEFCLHIFDCAKVKTLPGGIQLNGPRLASVTQTYINTISSGDLPCMENAVLALAQMENTAAMKKAIAHYVQQMDQKVQLPTDTFQELLDLHRTSEREAITIFLKTSFKDEGNVFQKELMVQLEQRWDSVCNQNVKASTDRCSELLQNIFGPFEEAVRQGAYSQPGGYLLFIEKREELKKKYLEEPRKGIQAKEILQTYLQSREAVTEAILQRDQALTEKEKEIEVERAKAESAQATVKTLEEMQRAHEQRMQEKERRHQEHVRQLTAKMENVCAQLREEHGKVLALKRQEQEKLLKEGLKKESRRLQNEIQVMQMRNSKKEAESAQAATEMLKNMQEMKVHVAHKGDSRQEHAKELAGRSEKEKASECQVTMTSGPMQAPMCLVENQNQKMSVNPEAVQILSGISQPVVVVAIVGMYRTGKSYLMNCLAGQNHGFPLGSTVQSKTKGIWMWCVPHPTKPDLTLVLLDTEGLGDVEKGDPKNDSWIFALAVLLSSTFVYNSMGTINHDALEKLHYVTELTELIRAKSSSRPNGIEDATNFVSFFPDFVWTVRDFTLELKLDGRPITEDEYLENALKLIPEKNPQLQTANQPRECIKQFFPRRKCFVFDWPVSDPGLLAQMEDIPESQLTPRFTQQSKTFCSHIFTCASAKTLREGILVTGSRLGALVTTYVDAINSGAVPCLDDAVTTLAQRENSAAVQKAADHYSEQMVQRARLPTDTLQELLDVHAACEREAIAVFMERSFKDNECKFQKELLGALEERKAGFLLQNEEASTAHCQAELEKLSQPLMESISRGDFSVSGGHSLYIEAKKKIEQGYEQVPRKGVKAKEILQRFLQSQATVEDSILQSDKALEDGQRAIAAEQARREVAEKEAELLRQKQEEQEQVMEAQGRSFQENMAQMKEKMARERENFLREQKVVLEHMQKLQEELLNEGFEAKFEKLTREIMHIKKTLEAANNDNLFLQILDKAGSILLEAMPLLLLVGKVM